MKYDSKLFPLLAMIWCLTGCSTLNKSIPMSDVQVEESAHTNEGWTRLTLPSAAVAPLMMELSPYADMADATYRHEFSSAEARLAHGCDYLTSGNEKEITRNLPTGWRRLDRALMTRLRMDLTERPLQPCRSGKGLDYETYVRLDAQGQPQQAVIAFRGTENTRYQWLDDWVANFSNVDFGLGSNPQFAETRLEGSRLIQALVAVLPKVESSATCKLAMNGASRAQTPIDLVGHSLGGGLAQHLAFYSHACDVRKTVTFDTSPADGWFYLKRTHNIKTPDPVIERVYLDGEGLAFMRKVSTKFNLVRNNRRDYRIDFAGVQGNPVHLHSMTLLSDKIKESAGIMLDDDPGMIVHYYDKAPHTDLSGGEGTD